MSRVSHADDAEARRLRGAIAEELLALRQTFSLGAGSPSAGGDIAAQIGAVLRANPAWAAGVAAGAVAGVISAVLRRLRGRDRGPNDREAASTTPDGA
jgi:hypothetical protein